MKTTRKKEETSLLIYILGDSCEDIEVTVWNWNKIKKVTVDPKLYMEILALSFQHILYYLPSMIVTYIGFILFQVICDL